MFQMRSAANPLPEDILAWAYDENSTEPLQDWDLILSWHPNDDLYLQLAEDSNCPNQIYFLKLLYLIVGDGVRTVFKTRSEDTLRNFIQKGMNAKPYSLHLWAKRSLQLLDDPTQFNYNDWCAGGLALATE